MIARLPLKWYGFPDIPHFEVDKNCRMSAIFSFDRVEIFKDISLPVQK